MRYLTTVLAWTACLLGTSDSDVYTSSLKIQEMALLEEQILNNLHVAISNLGNESASSCFSQFYWNRLPEAKERQKDPHLLGYLKHPNGVYHTIKQFATEYQPLRSALGSASPDVEKQLSSIADQRDVTGAKYSFIRLQRVYNLSASDMVRGDYFGYIGPPLSYVDAFEIGEVAFRERLLDLAIDWLQEAMHLIPSREPSVGFLNNVDNTAALSGRIYALLGRSFVRKENTEKALELYTKAKDFDPYAGDVIELARELDTKPQYKKSAAKYDAHEDFTRLCTLQNKLTQSKFDSRLVCSYKQAILPYYRFKMELLSVSPYVALFYDVISDSEGQTIINYGEKKLTRGVVVGYGQHTVEEIRTSDLSFVHDKVSPIITGVSKRVGAVTNLVTKPYVPEGDYFVEPFQVVNYGMGGHYEVHTDVFDEASLDMPALQNLIVPGGNRLATFLIYLTDVERGGSTVFVNADLAVSPVKNMALFWYNFTPSGKEDQKTKHAGCPVVIGHKWVTNKWIWLHGNAFSRRCGLKRKATQLDIDPQMRRGWV